MSCEECEKAEREELKRWKDSVDKLISYAQARDDYIQEKMKEGNIGAAIVGGANGLLLKKLIEIRHYALTGET